MRLEDIKLILKVLQDTADANGGFTTVAQEIAMDACREQIDYEENIKEIEGVA